MLKILGKWSGFSIFNIYVISKVAMGNFRRCLLHIVFFKGIYAFLKDEDSFYGLLALSLASIMILLNAYI